MTMLLPYLPCAMTWGRHWSTSPVSFRLSLMGVQKICVGQRHADLYDEFMAARQLKAA